MYYFMTKFYAFLVIGRNLVNGILEVLSMIFLFFSLFFLDYDGLCMSYVFTLDR